MMINLFIAVVLEGFTAHNKQINGEITQEILEEVVNVWEIYDPNGTGWISLNDIVFFMCDIVEPMGIKNFYETDIKNILEEKLDKIKANGGQNILDMRNIFIVRPPTEHEKALKRQNGEMSEESEDENEGKVIPWIEANKVLSMMKLPVYTNENGEYQCHLRDVIKKLSRRMLEANDKPEYECEENGKIKMNKEGNPANQIGGYDPKGIELKHLMMLDQAWEDKHYDLK
jgi:hypothetical protein